MGGEEPPPPPAPVFYTPPPSGPSSTEMTRDALAAQLEFAPKQLELYKTIGPEQAQIQTDIQKTQAPQLAQIQLDLQKQFTPQQVDLALETVKRADPQGFAIRETLGKQIQSDLEMGGALNPEETRLAQQDVRAAQVSRGGGTSLGEGLEEAQYLGNQRFQRGQQRQAAASSFLAGIPTPQQGANQTPTPQAGSQPIIPFQQLMPSTTDLVNTERSRYGPSQLYAQPQQEASPNPFMQGLGMAVQVGGAVAAGF